MYGYYGCIPHILGVPKAKQVCCGGPTRASLPICAGRGVEISFVHGSSLYNSSCETVSTIGTFIHQPQLIREPGGLT